MKKLIISLLIILSIFLVSCQESTDNIIPIKQDTLEKLGDIKDPIEYIGDCKYKDSEFQQDTCWIQKAALTKSPARRCRRSRCRCSSRRRRRDRPARRPRSPAHRSRRCAVADDVATDWLGFVHD